MKLGLPADLPGVIGFRYFTLCPCPCPCPCLCLCLCLCLALGLIPRPTYWGLEYNPLELQERAEIRLSFSHQHPLRWMQSPPQSQNAPATLYRFQGLRGWGERTLEGNWLQIREDAAAALPQPDGGRVVWGRQVASSATCYEDLAAAPHSGGSGFQGTVL